MEDIVFLTEFQLTDEVKATIKEAQSKFKQTSSNVQFQYLLYENLSRELFKRSQLYPDAMMQLVFQVINNSLYLSYNCLV